ncbi:hypothetical protein [Streptomyces sp. NPDC002889]|uniref:hypothetical protein n=1 Tax=Streptomyces sp. NPDC002889 TaxID=3364669 RepID=UPI0036CA889F
MSKTTLQRWVAGARLPTRDIVQHLVDLAAEHLPEPPGPAEYEGLWKSYETALAKKKPVLHQFYVLMRARDEALARAVSAEARSARLTADMERVERELAAVRNQLDRQRQATDSELGTLGRRLGQMQEECAQALRTVEGLQHQLDAASRELTAARQTLIERDAELARWIQETRRSALWRRIWRLRPARGHAADGTDVLEDILDEYNAGALPEALVPGPGTTSGPLLPAPDSGTRSNLKKYTGSLARSCAGVTLTAAVPVVAGVGGAGFSSLLPIPNAAGLAAGFLGLLASTLVFCSLLAVPGFAVMMSLLGDDLAERTLPLLARAVVGTSVLVFVLGLVEPQWLGPLGDWARTLATAEQTSNPSCISGPYRYWC